MAWNRKWMMELKGMKRSGDAQGVNSLRLEYSYIHPSN